MRLVTCALCLQTFKQQLPVQPLLHVRFASQAARRGDAAADGVQARGSACYGNASGDAVRWPAQRVPGDGHRLPDPREGNVLQLRRGGCGGTVVLLYCFFGGFRLVVYGLGWDAV